MLGGGQFSSQALSRCVERGVRITALQRSGRVKWTLGGPTTGNVLLRVAQVRAADTPSTTAAIARWVVAGKLQNCRRMVSRWLWDAEGSARWLMQAEREAIEDRIRALPGVEDGDQLRGIEGDGSRRYFKCLGAHLAGSRTALVFSTRTRRPPRDEVNALLSFFYGLVLAEAVGALEAVGLDPQIGFLHRLRPGRPSLALDLIEEFRPPLADRLAVGLITPRTIRSQHFTRTAGGAVYLSDDGRRIALAGYEEFKSGTSTHLLLDRDMPRWALFSVQATLLARHLRGDLPAYPPIRARSLMDLLVTYDISTVNDTGQRRLARVAAVCERFGTRVQYSVFESRLAAASHQRMIGELLDEIDPHADSVHTYQFPGTLADSRTSLGRPATRALGDPWII